MILAYKNKTPFIDESCFIAENAAVLGDVTLERGASVWFGAVLRGDMAAIKVGTNSNIQENATVHVSPGHPVTIGCGVTVGHGAVVHGATVGDNVLVGMNAVVLDTANTVVPENTLMLGVPATAAKTLSPAAAASNAVNAAAYVKLAKDYKQ